MNNAQKPSEAEKPRKKMMLVIDDDSLVLESCRRIFKDEGYEVSTADNPREGLALASKSSYDVILCDWRMPEMKGIEVVEILGKQCRDSAIIMITGFPALERAINAFKRGAIDYIAKPFTPDEIVNVVNEALNLKKEKTE